MKRKNRENLLNYILIALDSNDYMSYAEIVEYIEQKQNISLACYEYPAMAVKSVILDYGIYLDGKVAGRYKGDKPLFLASEQKEVNLRRDKVIKWKKIYK